MQILFGNIEKGKIPYFSGKRLIIALKQQNYFLKNGLVSKYTSQIAYMSQLGDRVIDTETNMHGVNSMHILVRAMLQNSFPSPLSLQLLIFSL